MREHQYKLVHQTSTLYPSKGLHGWNQTSFVLAALGWPALVGSMMQEMVWARGRKETALSMEFSCTLHSFGHQAGLVLPFPSACALICSLILIYHQAAGVG